VDISSENARGVATNENQSPLPSLLCDFSGRFQENCLQNVFVDETVTGRRRMREQIAEGVCLPEANLGTIWFAHHESLGHVWRSKGGMIFVRLSEFQGVAHTQVFSEVVALGPNFGKRSHNR